MGYSTDQIVDLSPWPGDLFVIQHYSGTTDPSHSPEWVRFLPFEWDSDESAGLRSIPPVLDFHSAGTLSESPEVMRGFNMSEPMPEQV